MNLLPEFRKSSKLDGTKNILFGTIDCTVNADLCERYNIRSYPTTVLFNNSVPHNYVGHHSAEDISDFVEDILKPSVITLTYDTFHSMVGQKPKGKIWLIDFYASWCQPCQQLAPEWRKLAKRIDSNIGFVGQVDCVTEQQLCAEQHINSYPNIRIFPAEHEGSDYYEQFQGWMRDSNSLFQWASDYFPSRTYKLDMENFERLVLNNLKSNNPNDQQPWLVDFYAPWCGHCQVFSPTFEALAAKLEGKVKFGKVNCQFEQYLCQIVGIRAFPTIRFYPLGSSHGLDWSSGDNIELYDYDSILNVVQNKVKKLGYKTAVKDEL
jgi:DnaJ family protein C protein 10